jgi:hypothetical protein
MNGESFVRRFLTKIDPQPDGCWLWTSATNNRGYGKIRRNMRWVLAHRASYELFVGPIPVGIVVDHRCDTPLCVNPLHLELSTNADNVLRGSSPLAKNARKTHCPYGHPFDGTRRARQGFRKPSRVCKVCMERQRVKDGVRVLLRDHAVGLVKAVLGAEDLTLVWDDGMTVCVPRWRGWIRQGLEG